MYLRSGRGEVYLADADGRRAISYSQPSSFTIWIWNLPAGLTANEIQLAPRQNKAKRLTYPKLSLEDAKIVFIRYLKEYINKQDKKLFVQ